MGNTRMSWGRGARPRRAAAFAIGLALAAGSLLVGGSAQASGKPVAKTPSAPNSSCYPSGGQFHCYAIGWDNTHGPYWGLGVTRSDINISGIAAGSNCSAAPTINPGTTEWSFPGGGGIAYQSQWITLAGQQGQDWEELGTGHRCNYENFWYWGYGLNANWYPLGVHNQSYIGPNAQHRFSIFRAGNTWYYQVDNTTMSTTPNWGTTTGTSVQFGLESWDSGASTTGQPYFNIQYVNGNAQSVNISGRQGTTVDPWMCGVWSSDTEWWGGEGSGCGFSSAAAAQAAAARSVVTSTSASQAAAMARPIPMSGRADARDGMTSAQLTDDCTKVAKTETERYGVAGSVVGAYTRTSAAVTGWKSHHLAMHGKSLNVAQTDATGPVAICAIKGNYEIPTPPPAPGTAPMTYDLAIVTVDSHGQVRPFAYGNEKTLADLLTPPTAS